MRGVRSRCNLMPSESTLCSVERPQGKPRKKIARPTRGLIGRSGTLFRAAPTKVSLPSPGSRNPRRERHILPPFSRARVFIFSSDWGSLTIGVFLCLFSPFRVDRGVPPLGGIPTAKSPNKRFGAWGLATRIYRGRYRFYSRDSKVGRAS